jgi:hypothetical protein
LYDDRRTLTALGLVGFEPKYITHVDGLLTTTTTTTTTGLKKLVGVSVALCLALD